MELRTGTSIPWLIAEAGTKQHPVVLAKSDLIDKLGVACFPSIPLRAPVVRPFDCTLRLFSEPCSAANRDPRASPSTGPSAAVGEAAEADLLDSVGVAVINLAGLAIGTDHDQTGDGHGLAPKGIPPLLEVEIPL